MTNDALTAAQAGLEAAQAGGDARSIAFYRRQVSFLTAPSTPAASSSVGLTVDPLAGMIRASRAVLGSALRDTLKAEGLDGAWTASLAAQSQDTRDWWASGYRDLIREDAVKLVRIAGACTPAVDVKALFDAVLTAV